MPDDDVTPEADEATTDGAARASVPKGRTGYPRPKRATRTEPDAEPGARGAGGDAAGGELGGDAVLRDRVRRSARRSCASRPRRGAAPPRSRRSRSTATTCRSSSGDRLDAGTARKVATTPAATRRRRCSRRRRTYGAAGSAGRFQVFAHVQSTSTALGRDVQGRRRRGSRRWSSRGCRCTPAPTGTSASAGRCTASCSTATRRCATSTSPSEFEGHPLRKDFPLLARVVKPWPGLVDVEPMPESTPRSRRDRRRRVGG